MWNPISSFGSYICSLCCKREEPQDINTEPQPQVEEQSPRLEEPTMDIKCEKVELTIVEDIELSVIDEIR